MVQPLCKKSMEVPQKVKHRITIHTCPQEFKARTRRQSLTPKFTAALLTRAQGQTQPSRLLASDEWVYKVRSVSIVNINCKKGILTLATYMDEP